MEISRQRTWPQWLLLATVVAAALLVQAPLVFNPGYFSHDELQWAAFASEHPGWYFRDYLWTGLQTFQYRPLTFSLWLWLSQQLFAHPYAFHGVTVAWGALNAGMLALLLRRFAVAPGAALVGALLFALSPFAIFTHAWVGTIGDLIWVSCALAIGLLAQRDRSMILTAAGSAVITALGLLAKESAVVIPALTAMAWLMLGRRRGWAWATIGAMLPVAAYLSARLGVILFSPREASNYGWSLTFIPLRWLEYQLFPMVQKRLEMAGVLGDVAKTSFWISAIVWLALVHTFLRAGRRWLLAFLLVGMAALGPVLILSQSANQYGYGFAAAIVGLGVAVWPRVGRAGRVVLVVAALLSTWHGINIMRRMHHVGEVQAVFSQAVADAVARSNGNAVRLRVGNPHEIWIYQRLTHQIPTYRGVAIGDRVGLVDNGSQADYLIGPDGSLTPLAEAATAVSAGSGASR